MKQKYKYLLGMAFIFGPLIVALIYSGHPIWAGFVWMTGAFTLTMAMLEAKEAKEKAPGNEN